MIVVSIGLGIARLVLKADRSANASFPAWLPSRPLGRPLTLWAPRRGASFSRWVGAVCRIRPAARVRVAQPAQGFFTVRRLTDSRDDEGPARAPPGRHTGGAT
ncbi:hypothetical protein Shyhy02_82880 [Streptomyces hygroscopicus subsp. hygroscopicus]|nr:hypothetical protein Shyhy02_82880 [Streptomyces hygroscopicus subsp. hygroscopicus]